MEEEDGQAAARACADAWGLSAVRPMGRTFSSFLFRTEQGGRALVLKVFTPAGRPEEAVGAAALAWFAGDGAAEVHRRDAGAVAMEFLPGEDLLALVRAGRDEDAARILGEVGRRLHARSQRGVPPELTPLEARIRVLEGRAGGAAPVLGRGAAVARALLADGVGCCVLHGDLHHENVRRRASGAWAALDPKGLVGERAYDGARSSFDFSYASY